MLVSSGRSKRLGYLTVDIRMERGNKDALYLTALPAALMTQAMNDEKRVDQKSESAFCLIRLNELGLSFHNCKLIGIKKDDDGEEDGPCPNCLFETLRRIMEECLES